MQSEQWTKIEEIFHDALGRSPTDRSAYLREVCGNDQDLHTELLTLLDSYEKPIEALEKTWVTAGFTLLAVSEEELLSGETLDHYVLQRKIGRGGMGTIYLAYDNRLDRRVAIKLLPASVVDHPGSIARLQREARAASRITHPNIGHIYEFGEAAGRHYIVMEYIEGISLRDRLRERSLNVAETINLALQVARALTVAHTNGVLHRDIKPDNLMIHPEGYVKILDFGIAKSTANNPQLDDEDYFQTEAGIIVGSPAYMSPEQARGLDVDRRTDLWSLGIVMYESLSGKNPFLADTRTDTLAAILKSEPTPLTELCEGLPEQMGKIVGRLLAKDREDRYPTAHALIQDLEELNESFKVRQATQILAADELLNQRHPRSTARNVQRLSDDSQRVKRSLSARLPGPLQSAWVRIALIIVIAIGTVGIVRLVNFKGSNNTLPKVSSIAVLPLVNRSGDPAVEYLRLGLSESLIDRFSRLSNLKVIARDSSFKYQGTEEIKSIAAKLDVQGIIIGSITTQGNQRQIELELVDVASTSRIWSGSYKYEINKLPGTINDICLAISKNLNVTNDELSRLTKQPDPSGSAYDNYLKGKIEWSLLSEESIEKSINYFNEAVTIDPEYALAYAGLANSYVTMGANYRTPADEFAKAQEAAQKALAIDDTLAEAHYAIAVTKYLSWDFSAAETESKRALELNPNYAPANSLLCSLSLTKGDTKQAYSYIKRALELDPLSPLFNTHLAFVFYCLHENDQAVKQLQNLLLIEPSATFAYNDIARVYAQQGRFSDALASSQRATVLLGQDPNTLSSMGIVYALAGRIDDAEWVIQRLENLNTTKHVQSYWIASIYSAMGNKDMAFEWLEKANAEKSPQMLRLRVDPVFDKIRTDSRYGQLLKVAGFI